jgi:hypothetical protein
MKIQEDPWENYLYYDSKFILPLICHSQEMAVEEQVLVALFLRHTVAEQTISQYKLPANELLQEMIKFTAENHSDEEVPLLETLRHAIS